MGCYHPLTAYRTSGGAVVFSELKRFDVVDTLSLPCGRCDGCRLERSRQWAIRCMHEAQLNVHNCFLTLTYRDVNMPVGRSLLYSDFQLFMKRFRARFNRACIRFYMCGEYDEGGRPHFHACIFGFDFPDKVYFRKTPAGSKVYRSEILESLWSYGFSSVGAVTFQSAAYVARYCMAKAGGGHDDRDFAVVDSDTGECTDRVAEFNHMSLRPGIGARWFDKFAADVYPEGRVVINGAKCSPPRYYDKLYARLQPDDRERLAFARELGARSRYSDNTPERLAVKEQVTAARVSMLKRSLGRV